MCRYAVVQVDSDEATASGKLGKVLALRHDYAAACQYAEDEVKKNGKPLEVFERVSVAKPTTAVVFEGRRRPGVGA
jgi:hypothetical protein